MLDKLDRVDWANLHHADGTAEGIQQLLLEMAKAVTSRDAERHWREIAEEILHLIDPDNVGVITKVTPQIIPFWVQILKQAKDVEEAHYLLADIGFLLSGETLYNHYGEELRTKFEEQGRNYDEEIRLGPTFVQQTYDAASQHIDYFLSFINHPSGGFRKNATFVLSKFPEHAIRLVPTLIERYALELNETVRDEIVLSLRKLTQGSRDFSVEAQANQNAFFLHIIQSEKQRAVGVRSAATGPFQAALALVSKLGVGIPKEAIDVLAQAAIECSEIDEWDLSLEIASEALATLGAERGIPIFLTILRTGRSAGRNTVVEVVKPLLDLAFGKPTYDIWWAMSHPFRHITYLSFDVNKEDTEIEPVNKLTQQQREVVRAIVETEKIWAYETNLFEWYGLPTSREMLQALR